MLLTDNIEVRSFSTYTSSKYKLLKNEIHLSFTERTYDNIFEPVEIAYYNKNIVEHNVNIIKNVNKFKNYDI